VGALMVALGVPLPPLNQMKAAAAAPNATSTTTTVIKVRRELGMEQLLLENQSIYRTDRCIS
jgi:hypothetical protein